MMADVFTCANCDLWQPRDREHDYAAPCALGVYTRPYADMTCDLHSGHDTVPTGPVDMQSQARGGPPWPNPGRAQWVKP